ncbi:MAG: protein-L-isoaspartate(D-aspartate) O-methyltransferase [Desulfurococcaceae archaeon]
MELPFEKQRKIVVEELKRLGIIRSEAVERALLSVPRELFVPEDLRKLAYLDQPLPIGHGQTISAIHMVAEMTEELDARPGHRVLEVGAGSGYQAAVLAEIVCKAGGERRGHVFTIERIPELAEFARRNLGAAGYSDCATVVVGDGTLGLPEKAPFDRIIVTAAAPDVPPPLVEQLANGGRLVIPVGDLFVQRLLVLQKDSEGKISRRYGAECVFVPLIGRYGWRFRP